MVNEARIYRAIANINSMAEFTPPFYILKLIPHKLKRAGFNSTIQFTFTSFRKLWSY